MLRRSRNRGASILEVLVALSFSSLLLAETTVWTRTALVSLRDRDAHAARERSMWLALELMVLDLRDAGYHANGEAMVGLLAGDARSLQVVADLDGDGTTTGSGERIAYGFDPAARVVRRSTGAAGAQVLSDPLPEHVLEIAYFDALNQELMPEASGLSPGQRSAVWRVELGFRHEAKAERRIHTSVQLRNAR